MLTVRKNAGVARLTLDRPEIRNAFDDALIAAVTQALRELGLGVALKVEDGGGRAAPVALLALLEAIGALSPAQLIALDEVARPVLRNHAGRVVGRIEPAPGWPDSAQMRR